MTAALDNLEIDPQSHDGGVASAEIEHVLDAIDAAVTQLRDTWFQNGRPSDDFLQAQVKNIMEKIFALDDLRRALPGALH